MVGTPEQDFGRSERYALAVCRAAVNCPPGASAKLIPVSTFPIM